MTNADSVGIAHTLRVLFSMLRIACRLYDPHDTINRQPLSSAISLSFFVLSLMGCIALLMMATHSKEKIGSTVGISFGWCAHKSFPSIIVHGL
ncbi:hypothetical protein WDW86_00535 [Bdellovibrionota bacterium FG-2]